MSLDVPAFLWLALAIFAGIVEVSIPHFGSIFVSVGAVAAAAAAYLGFGVTAEVVTFAVALGLSLGVLRPRFLARLGAPGVPSRTEILRGREGVVTVNIDPAVGEGRVNVGGEDWAARSAMPMPAGTKIRVMGADGIVLEVARA